MFMYKIKIDVPLPSNLTYLWKNTTSPYNRTTSNIVPTIFTRQHTSRIACFTDAQKYCGYVKIQEYDIDRFLQNLERVTPCVDEHCINYFHSLDLRISYKE
jgi:hypothetical protein